MSPELLNIILEIDLINKLELEISNIFSFGVIFLRLCLMLVNEDVIGLNTNINLQNNKLFQFNDI